MYFSQNDWTSRVIWVSWNSFENMLHFKKCRLPSLLQNGPSSFKICKKGRKENKTRAWAQAILKINESNMKCRHTWDKWRHSLFVGNFLALLTLLLALITTVLPPASARWSRTFPNHSLSMRERPRLTPRTAKACSPKWHAWTMISETTLHFSIKLPMRVLVKIRRTF